MFFSLRFLSCVVDTTLCMFLLIYVLDAGIAFSKRNSLALLLLAAAGALVDTLVNGNIGTMSMIMFFPPTIYFLSRKERILPRIGGCLLSFLLYISFSIFSVFIEMLVFGAVFGETGTNARFTIITICLNALIIWGIWNYFARRNLSIHFSIREWLLLLAVNVVTFLILTAVSYFNEQIVVKNMQEQLLLIVLNYSVVFLYIFFMLFLASGQVASHFKELNHISRRHMAEQLQYFTSYKQMQEDTRKFRHDMKNHLLFLQALSSEERYPEVDDYLKSLAERWEELPRLYTTGNEVIDTIINAKQFNLQENDIPFSVIGQFVTNINIKSIDLCTIFSNVIDNAIEANSKLPAGALKYIEFAIRRTHNHYLVSVKNPVASPVQIRNNYIVSDKAEDGHGYGLRNIARALHKYDGYMKLSGNIEHFTIEIVFLV